MENNLSRGVGYGDIGGFGSGFNEQHIHSYPVVVQQHHNIYIDGDIGEVQDHRLRIEAIRTAPEGDVIRLIINTAGGQVDTMISYIRAIKETKAKVIGHAEGFVASAGTSIWISCHEHTVAEYTGFMFHNIQYGVGGDASNIERAVQFNSSWGKELINGLYEGFLTEEEIKIISSAGEVYLNRNEAMKRLPDFYAKREERDASSCECEECQEVREAEERGYYSVELKPGRGFNIPISGDIPDETLEEYDIEEWRTLADILQVPHAKNDSKKRIRSKIMTFIKSDNNLNI